MGTFSCTIINTTTLFHTHLGASVVVVQGQPFKLMSSRFGTDLKTKKKGNIKMIISRFMGLANSPVHLSFNKKEIIVIKWDKIKFK